MPGHNERCRPLMKDCASAASAASADSCEKTTTLIKKQGGNKTIVICGRVLVEKVC
jgi:hypothetical protein